MTVLDIPGIDVLPGVRSIPEAPRRMLIGDEWVDAADGRTFATLDPSTGEPLAHVAEAGEVDIDRAVRSARRAFEGPWRSIPASERARLMMRLADLVADNAEELAQIESLDSGKPVTYARAVDLPLAIEHLRYFAGWPTKIEGQVLPVTAPDMLTYVRSEPVGVVGAIIAWNFPLLLAAWKLGPALAAGCTLVLKPAEETPLSALRLGELILEAGIPEGVVNICPGFGERAGAALVRHPDVDLITFTGSRETGVEVARSAAGTLKRVSLELGGKSPNIVLPDADIDAAAAAAAQAIFFNSGQVCSAGSRLLVHRTAFDRLVESVADAGRSLVPGPGLDPATTLGPLVSQEQLQRVSGYVDRGRAEGASVASGGGRFEAPAGDGYFFEPTVLVDVPDHVAVCREEIFGPVVVAQSFDTVEEAVARANATDYGLAAAVWTGDMRAGHRVAAALNAGTVWINTYHQYDAVAPFGGFKQSGYGRDAGRAALEKFLNPKTIWANLV